jgi:hypothetical protein
MPLWKKIIVAIYKFGLIAGYILFSVEATKIFDRIFNLKGIAYSVPCFVLLIIAIYGKGIEDGAL